MFEFAATSVLLALAADSADPAPPPSAPGYLLVATWADGTQLWRPFGSKEILGHAQDMAGQERLARMLEDMSTHFYFQRVSGAHTVPLAFLRIDLDDPGNARPSHLKLGGVWFDEVAKNEDIVPKVLWFLLSYLGMKPKNIPSGAWLKLGLPVWVDPDTAVGGGQIFDNITLENEQRRQPLTKLREHWNAYLAADEEDKDDAAEQVTIAARDYVDSLGELFVEVLPIHRQITERDGLYLNISMFQQDLKDARHSGLIHGEIQFSTKITPVFELKIYPKTTWSLLNRVATHGENPYSTFVKGPAGTVYIHQRPSGMRITIDPTKGVAQALIKAGIMAEAKDLAPFIRDLINKPNAIHRPINWQTHLLLRQTPIVLLSPVDLHQRYGA